MKYQNKELAQSKDERVKNQQFNFISFIFSFAQKKELIETVLKGVSQRSKNE